jgi:hypothetical protein
MASSRSPIPLALQNRPSLVENIGDPHL